MKPVEMMSPQDETRFFIIGAPKCGTTSLAAHLGEHPEVAFCDPKEPHYFSPDYPFGPPEIASVDAYENCFPRNSFTRAVGEGSVFYLYSDVAIRGIEEYSDGKALYIVCLRNPVDASFSLHAQHVAFGWEPERDYLSALRRSEDESRAATTDQKIANVLRYASLYQYASYLQRLGSMIERDRTLFFVLEEHSSDLPSFYSAVHDFIGVSQRTVAVNVRHNEARRVGSDLAYRILTTPAVLAAARFARRLLAPNGFGLGRPIRRISDEERRAARAIFEQDIAETARIVGFDPALWNETR